MSLDNFCDVLIDRLEQAEQRENKKHEAIELVLKRLITLAWTMPAKEAAPLHDIIDDLVAIQRGTK